MHLPDKFASNAPMLVSAVNGQVRKVAAVAEVRKRTGHSDQPLIIPGRYDEVRVINHAADAV